MDFFSDNIDNYRNRITARKCVGGNRETNKKFCRRVKNAVDKGWPLDTNGTQAEIYNQLNQRKAKYVELTVRSPNPTDRRKKLKKNS